MPRFEQDLQMARALTRVSCSSIKPQGLVLKDVISFALVRQVLSRNKAYHPNGNGLFFPSLIR